MYSSARLILALLMLFARTFGVVVALGETALVIYLLVTKQWAAAAFVVFVGSLVLHFVGDLIVNVVSALSVGVAQRLSPQAVEDYAQQTA
jgi:predicted phage tail protein